MQHLIQNIVNRLNHLPQSKLHEVLDFVEFLGWREDHKRQSDFSHSELEATDQEFELLVDQLSSEITNSFGKRVPSLSDEAVSRAGIYEEHP